MLASARVKMMISCFYTVLSTFGGLLLLAVPSPVDVTGRTVRSAYLQELALGSGSIAGGLLFAAGVAVVWAFWASCRDDRVFFGSIQDRLSGSSQGSELTRTLGLVDNTVMLRRFALAAVNALGAGVLAADINLGKVSSASVGLR